MSRPKAVRLARRVTGLVLLMTAFTPGAASAYEFAPDSAWDAPLPDGAPLAPGSELLVGELRRQIAVAGTFVNTTSYSTPVYTVPAAQPTVRVTLDTAYGPLQDDFLSVPMPVGAVPARGNDQHLVIRQPETDTLWEFWKLALRADGWHARWGGKMANVSSNPGYFAAPFGATATSLPLLGGLMTREELEAGQIDHALALAIPAAARGAFVWPAQRTDGIATDAAAIPEGTRFRVDPAFDVEAMTVKPAIKAMVRAAQRYGIIVRDQAGSVVFFAEDPTPWGANPYPAIFGTKWLDHNNALKSFPWNRLQAVDPLATATVMGSAKAGKRQHGRRKPERAKGKSPRHPARTRSAVEAHPSRPASQRRTRAQ